MAHKTLVGGTAYNISGGKSLVSGTAYNIKKGKTLVGGTGYNINFESNTEAVAMLYNTGDFVFQRSMDVEEGKSLVASYTNFEDTSYSNYENLPWHSQRINISNLYCRKKIAPTSLSYWFYNMTNLAYINYINFNLNKVSDMVSAYERCHNLTGSPVCGANVTNMARAYYNCLNLTGRPVCGPNITDMSNAYTLCHNLTSFPVCGANVTNMARAYESCSNLTGSPVCGPNVIDMSYAYSSCSKLTGSPVCGANVVIFNGAYSECSNLTGSPVCGNNVTNIAYTYSSCIRLKGAPVCRSKITNMVCAYKGCYNLTGSPVCGTNVTNMYSAYDSCKNVSGNAYFYSSIITNAARCFRSKNNSRKLNIYVPSGSTTQTTVLYTNSKSLVGTTITWTKVGTYHYNTRYNIYIYPVANVAAAAIANGDEEANTNAGIQTSPSGTSGGSG